MVEAESWLLIAIAVAAVIIAPTIEVPLGFPVEVAAVALPVPPKTTLAIIFPPGQGPFRRNLDRHLFRGILGQIIQ